MSEMLQTRKTSEMSDDKTIINIAAAAAKHRHELPPTYRPSVRDVCETSYSLGAKEWHDRGRNSALDDAVTLVRQYGTIYDEGILIKELEKLKNNG
jgi:hypothetical protein